MALCVAHEPAAAEQSDRPGRKLTRRGWPPRTTLSGYAREIARGRSIMGLLGRLRPRDLLGRHPADTGPVVTVVVPMFNAAPFVERCLKSLLIQTHQTFRIVCVDDHSTDDTYGRAVDQFGADGRIDVLR